MCIRSHNNKIKMYAVSITEISTHDCLVKIQLFYCLYRTNLYFCFRQLKFPNSLIKHVLFYRAQGSRSS